MLMPGTCISPLPGWAENCQMIKRVYANVGVVISIIIPCVFNELRLGNVK